MSKKNKHFSSAIHKMNLAINKEESYAYKIWSHDLWDVTDQMIDYSHLASMIDDKKFAKIVEKLQKVLDELPTLIGDK